MSKNLLTPKERYKFLFRVTNKLTKSLNHTLSIKEISKLIVPLLADYCRIAMSNADGQITEIALNHNDPKKIPTASALFDAYKNDPNTTMGIPNLLRTGRPEILSVINNKVLKKMNANKLIVGYINKLGLKSYMGVPLIARGKIVGAMTFSSVKPDRHYTKSDLKFAMDIGRRVAFALDSARLLKSAQDELKERIQYETQLKFLAEASKILSTSLDYNVTLTNVAKLAIDYLADWCVIDMRERGSIKNVVIMHKDPKKIAYAHIIRQRQPPTGPESGVWRVLDSAKPEIYPEITPELIAKTNPDKKTLRIIKRIGIYSAMIVPIILKSEAIGAITLISSTPRYRYNNSDLAVSEEVASRTALAIENAKLYSESQEAVKLRDDFISIASHELKTPVTTLKMHTQLTQKLLKNSNNPLLLKSLDKMDNQINKLTGLIGDLLNVSRIQQGKLQFREDEFDLDKAVRDAVDSIQPTTNHRIIITGKINNTVWGDGDRIGQVIVNLLTNAIKYSPKADKIRVKMMSNKKSAKVSVRDYGIGIKKSYQKKIFKLFYRVTSSEASTFPGLGVGLYISNEIVKRHKGNLYVKSNYGKGSEFVVNLPFFRKPPVT